MIFARRTVLVVVLAFVALLRDPPERLAMMLSVCALNLAGVLTITEALAGFANEGLLTVAVVRRRGGDQRDGRTGLVHGETLGKPRTRRGAVAIDDTRRVREWIFE